MIIKLAHYILLDLMSTQDGGRQPSSPLSQMHTGKKKVSLDRIINFSKGQGVKFDA